MQRSEQEEECEEVSYMIISPCRFHHRSFAIAGVNLQSAWVGGAHLVGDDNGRPMCFRLASSILLGLPLNTKHQRWDAQSRLRRKARAHPSTLLCLPPLKRAHPQRCECCSKPGSVPKGVQEWKRIPWIIQGLLWCIHVHIRCTFFHSRASDFHVIFS